MKRALYHFLAATSASIAFSAPAAVFAGIDLQGLTREDQVVVTSGARLEGFEGAAISRMRLFAFSTETLSYAPIPFQVDERIDRLFTENTPLPFRETIYDVVGEDDGLLDADDELVFRFGDGGSRAPAEVPWPAGAEVRRVEIEARDPRPGANSVVWVYLFAGDELPSNPTRYIEWSGGVSDAISTSRYQLEYEGPWLLTGLRISAPCGDGSDVLDRVKGRARPLPNLQEDEEGWNTNASYLGGIAGPIRAIRYVRGATSGVNTLHHDIATPSQWTRRVNLRVHPLAEARLYLDFLPEPGARLFFETVPNGVVVDGAPDAGVPSTMPGWSLFRGGGGGLVTVFETPPSPKYTGPVFFYRDDASYDDRVPTNPDYGDDDDSSFGAHGLVISATQDSNLDPIRLGWSWYPICAGDGDAALGEAVQAIEESPFETTVVPQWAELAAIRDLEITEESGDLVLRWSSVASATAYRVFRSLDPSLPLESWEPIAEVSVPLYRRPAGQISVVTSFYSVVAINGGGVGPW
ncbi:MAG: hypothetical protein HC882_09180 [Acidobacteria bacterium]|nr:hypothetical protein [Acidobacteriota bacterium]